MPELHTCLACIVQRPLRKTNPSADFPSMYPWLLGCLSALCLCAMPHFILTPRCRALLGSYQWLPAQHPIQVFYIYVCVYVKPHSHPHTAGRPQPHNSQLSIPPRDGCNDVVARGGGPCALDTGETQGMGECARMLSSLRLRGWVRVRD